MDLGRVAINPISLRWHQLDFASSRMTKCGWNEFKRANLVTNRENTAEHHGRHGV